MILQKLKADAEAKLGEAVTDAVDHRAGLLQRRPAPGHQGRRPHRRPERPAHHQRAHRGRAGLRPRQGGRAPRARLRPRRRHLRRVGARAGRRRLRGASRPPATTTSAATTSTRRSSTGWSPSSSATRASTCAADRLALQRLYEAAEKAKIELSSTQSTQHQPAVRHGRRLRARSTSTCRSRAPSSTELCDDLRRAHRRPDQAGAGRRRHLRVRDRRRDPGRRHDPHAGRAGEGPRARRQGAAPRRQPGRGRRHRRRHPGRRAARRRQGRPAARRHPALPRHRDQGRRDDQADRAQHHDPDPQDRGLLHRGGRPDVGRDPRAPGRARDGAATTRRSASSSSWASRPRRAACRRSRSPSTSTPTASCSVSAKDRGTGNEQQMRIEGGSGPERGRDPEDGARRRDARRRRPRRQGARRRQERGRADRSTRPRSRCASTASSVDAETRERHRGRHRRPPLGCSRRATPRPSGPSTQALTRGLVQARRGDLRSSPGNQRPAQRAARRRRRRPEEEIIEDAEIVDSDDTARS